MPKSLSGSQTRRPRKSRESSGEISQKSTSSVFLLHRRQVVGVQRMRAAERLRVADEHRAGAERKEERLVRIEDERVRFFDAAQRGAAALGEHEERAVRAVDVEPQLLFTRHACELGQIIDRTGGGRAGAAGDEERRPAVASIARDRFFERVDADAELRVDGELADVGVRKAGEVRGFLKGVMDLVRAVERAAQKIIGQHRFARGDDAP